MSERLTLAGFVKFLIESACHLPIAEYARLTDSMGERHGITLKQEAAALAVDGGAH